MRTTSFGYLTILATTLVTLSSVGQAQPVRLERRDPVTKILKYVLYGSPSDDTTKNDEGRYETHESEGYRKEPEPSYSATPDEHKMLCLVNNERHRVGLHPLTLNPAMSQAAYQHSKYQSRAREMTHDDPQNGSLGERLRSQGFKLASAAENIAEGGDLSVSAVFDMWMNDPPHYQNIVDPNAKFMGLAKVDGFWTQDFGSSTDGPGYSSPSYEVHEYC
ncbi:hypothetical protein EV175_003863 [Coemansia sp. RSA 1933]|nr:hypothetical protein EV175_003863 [Coemansia sp. RSA 1933]